MAKTKGTALTVKKQDTALAAPMEDWEQELMEKVREEKAKEASGFQRITHAKGKLTLDDQPVKDNKLTGMIVGYVFSKAFYPGKYDPSKPQTPTCYAFARAKDGEASMVPHEASPDKQADQCKGCPHNVFGTADVGRGKRCKDERRLAVVLPVEDAEALASAEIRSLSVPPGSLKNWGNFLKRIDQITPLGVRAVLTEFSTEDLGGGHALTFRPTEKLDKEFVKEIVTKTASVEDMLIQPYPVIEEQQSAPARSNGKLDRKGRR